MRFDTKLEKYRYPDDDLPRNAPGNPSGIFIIPGPRGTPLSIIADDGTASGWEHVSVVALKAEAFKKPRSKRIGVEDTRTPDWLEMCHVKDLFWSEEECAVQFHPPRSDYVTRHPNCLHLWRWRHGEFPRPPSHLVGRLLPVAST